MSSTPRVRTGLRRDVAILLPVALALLVLLSTFTLFSYRSAISLLVEESRRDAITTSVKLAAAFAGDDSPSLDELQLLSPRVARVVLVDEGGRTVFERGPDTGAEPLAAFPAEGLDRPTAIGPGADDGMVIAIAPTSHAGRRHYVRVDIDAGTLSRQVASLGILFWVVLAANGGLSILVLLFLRHLLTPIDLMIDRARRLLPETSAVEDEVALLVSSFERAIDALEAERSPGDDELATLERTLGPNLESGMMLVDTHQKVLAVNRAGSDILGILTPTEPLPLQELLSARGGELFSVISGAISADRVVQRRETRLDRAGEEITLGLSVNPLRRNDGSSRAFLVLFADLTETTRLAREERVATTLEQVGELAAGVAHEMRNSLATIRGYLTLVERSPGEDSITDYLGELRREADHLQRVLDDFLSFARPESTRFEDVVIAAVLGRAAADPVLESTPIKITSLEVTIKGDAQLLERAVRNLLHNASQAITEVDLAPPIEVDTTVRSDRVRITIADRGVGIPQEIRATLFQPFVSGRGSGTGLGLALAHRIILLHEGSLSLEDRPGGGTVATVELPLAIGRNRGAASPADASDEETQR